MPNKRNQIHYAWIILFIGTLIVYGALGLGRFGYTIVLPSMQASLHLDNTQAGNLATANLVGYLALSVLGGALATRFGPKLIIITGLLFTGFGMFFTGAVNLFLTAAILRGITGIGSGATNVPIMALLTAWFAPRRRGFVSGIAVAGSSIGLIMLGPLVPRIVSTYGENGWRYSWYLFGGVTLALAIIAFLLLKNHPDEIGLKPYGDTETSSSSPSNKQNPDVKSIYRSPLVWHLGFAYAAFGFSYIIYMTFFSKYLISEGGYSPESAGNLFMTMGWFSLFCGLIWGTVSDYIGRKWALAMVFLMHTAAFGLFAIWRQPTGFTLSAIIFGLSAWSIPAVMSATCADLLGSRLAPAALGFITLFFGIGQAAGPSVAGALVDRTGSFPPAFILASIIAGLGAVSAVLLKPITLPIPSFPAEVPTIPGDS